MSAANMLWRHAREISCEMLPKTLRYSIPLILGQEQALFKAETLVITFHLDQDIPSTVVFDRNNLVCSHSKIQYAVELVQRDLLK